MVSTATQSKRDTYIAGWAKLAIAISNEFPDWGRKMGEGRHDTRLELTRDGMKFAITLDAHKGRLNVSTWNWPFHVEQDRGQDHKVEHRPNDLRDPSEETPSISVSADKTPQQIAKDIKGRFMGEYERLWARCAEVAARYQAEVNKHESAWAEVCKTIGEVTGQMADPSHKMHYASAGGHYSVTVQKGQGTTFEIKYSATAEEIRHVLEYRKAHPKPHEK